MAKKAYLFRHGLTKANLENKLVGATDIPLIEEGRKQAMAMRPLVERINAGAIYCSPMIRTVDTARLALGQEDPDMELDDDLREADFGDWEMMTYESAWNTDRKMALKWTRGDEDFCFPEGESLASFLARVGRVHERLIDEEEDTVLVFTHGGIIGQILCQMLHVPANRHMIFRIPPASLTIIDIHEGMGVLSGICPPEFYTRD
ncbi:MAG: histidine phosphatase family protein [Nitrospinota bacterium]|nr:histidine phosphatase family protein [Nitrospinota bacterium]MDH5677207.1 histidine phosphatase family protein [Nitrospinota bacterium]